MRRPGFRVLLLVTAIAATSNITAGEPTSIEAAIQTLPVFEDSYAAPPVSDWLITEPRRRAIIFRRGPAEVVMTNGLISRTLRLLPGAATVGYDNLMTGNSLIRGVKPEARLELDGKVIAVGGLLGQEEYAYLLPEWIAGLRNDPDAMQLTGVAFGRTAARFAWQRKRYSEDRPWPPPGVSMTLSFAHPEERYRGLRVEVHYELYDHIPVLAKWLVLHNDTGRALRLNRFTSEVLAVVEPGSSVEVPDRWPTPPMHVESDYAFHGMSYGSANETTHWVPDPQYRSQVNYRRQMPVQLESRPRIGPDALIAPGKGFETFRTYELLHDGDDRERQGLAVRRMYRTLAPWVTENPILMHVRNSDRESLRSAIDQCAEVGFEMVILTFGSGFDMENQDPAYARRLREDIEYAHARGIEVGGYSLLASRSIGPEHDVIHPETGKPGGAIYGNSPCLCSAWGESYFQKIQQFLESTGMDLLEHDGNYPGDVCASTSHPNHRGLGDSQWNQWQRITSFYRWCRGRGIYLNVPDWYFFNGSSKIGMGYRETNWSLPRERQIILGRQNIFDGTWEKTPSMGWMFVPLVQYHGGGAAATLEPLAEHLAAYEAHLMQNFGSGVQACYRGPRLYDSDATREVVRRWVTFYKKHRAILDSDIIHVRRADGRDLDCMMHVNPRLATRALAMVYNPTARTIEKRLRLPLYYAGLTGVARVHDGVSPPTDIEVARDHSISLPVRVPARGAVYYFIDSK